MSRRRIKDPVTGLDVCANTFYRINIEGKEPAIVRIIPRGDKLYQVIVFFDSKILCSGSYDVCLDYVVKWRAK